MSNAPLFICQRLFGIDSRFNLQPPHPICVFEPVRPPTYSFAIRSLTRSIRENTGGPAFETPPLIKLVRLSR